MTSPSRLSLAALPFLFALAAHAQHQAFKVNPDASEVNFTLGGSDHGTKGTFHVQQGTIDFDPKQAAIAGQVIVSAGSGKTGNDTRDKKMTTEVLEASRFSDVSFTPKSYQGTITPSGDSTITVTGTFTLHGTPHELTTPMQLHIYGTHCTAQTTFTVPYVKWGLKDPSIFILHVAKEVQVELKLAGDLSTVSP